DEDDFLAYAHLPYRSRQYAGPGWGLVGDAGSFMDPYYSPGLDHASMSVWATVRLVGRELRGELDATKLTAALDELNAANFLFDTGMYYLGIVQSRFDDLELLGTPAFGEDIWQSKLAADVMTAFKRRLIKL